MFDKFPICTWPILNLDENSISQVKMWSDMGVTINITPRYDYTIADKGTMIALLDECQKYNIKMFINDRRRTYWKGAAEDPEGYRKRFREAYADFGHHPAVCGFMIGDEPVKDDMPSVFTAMKIQLEEAPELIPYLNLLPIWVESNYMGYGSIENYFADIKANMPAPFICYDRYTQMNKNDVGKTIYFHDMRQYHSLAKEMNVPLWTCLLSTGHWRYMSPDEGAVRWQLNTALAGGCTGIVWFSFNELELCDNCRDAPVNMFGEKSPTYYYLANVCRTFLATTADTFKDLRLDDCYHFGKAWGGYPEFKPGVSDILLDLTTREENNMIVSFYTHKNGDKYMAVVNNSPTVNDLNFNLTFNTDTCNPKEIKLHGEEVEVFKTRRNSEKPAFVDRVEGGSNEAVCNRYTANFWAAAGQMYLFKL